METKLETSTLSTPDLCLLLEGTGTLQMSALKIEIFKTIVLAFPMTVGTKKDCENHETTQTQVTLLLFHCLSYKPIIDSSILDCLAMVCISAVDGYLQQNLKAKNTKAHSSLAMMMDRTGRIHMPVFIA